MFAKDNHNVLAVDISEDMIDVAKEKNTFENLNFELMDITKKNYQQVSLILLCIILKHCKLFLIFLKISGNFSN